MRRTATKAKSKVMTTTANTTMRRASVNMSILQRHPTSA
jgi:hypothetical protein